MGIYTVDMDVDNLPPSKDPLSYEPEDMEERDEYLKQKKLELKVFLIEIL